MPPPPRRRPPNSPRTTDAAPAMGERDIDAFQTELDRVPPPLEPLDVGMIDGFLCGVLLQPRPVPALRWLPYLTDTDGRPLPPGFDVVRLQRFALRRHAELDAAIGRRQWFDPWVYELAGDMGDPHHGDASRAEPAVSVSDTETDIDTGPPTAVDAVLPWVAGFAAALEVFPGLMQQGGERLTEPLALIYRHLDPDDLEDADELLAEIDSLEPPVDLAEAVEGLVRAVLLLADVARPLPADRRRQPTRGRPRRS